MILGGAKALAAFLSFGVLSFIGTWGVGLNTTVAKLKEDVAIIHEKNEFLAPWLTDQVKALREDMKDLRMDVKAIVTLQHEVARISAEQARRTAVIDSVRMRKDKND